VPPSALLITASMFPLVTAVEGCDPLWSIAMMSGFFNPFGWSLADEQSQLSVWAEEASPLLISTDLTTLTPDELTALFWSHEAHLSIGPAPFAGVD
jgi:hypothetical protein